MVLGVAGQGYDNDSGYAMDNHSPADWGTLDGKYKNKENSDIYKCYF
jgi:hypothetical protein